MRDQNGKLICDAELRVDKSDPDPVEGLVDLYVSVEDFRKLVKLFNRNRVTVALRMKGIG